SVDEVKEAYDKGELIEAFGTGTAAVISPIGELKIGDDVLTINNNEIGALSQRLYDTLTGIQWGELPDEFGWSVEVCK
ncbi:MAG: branched chain amino acid aminotransferase, partial [Clostridia bacterium]|nr:branched chain amino acid aminotransferase [Clostridia bacterium]